MARPEPSHNSRSSRVSFEEEPPSTSGCRPQSRSSAELGVNFGLLRVGGIYETEFDAGGAVLRLPPADGLPPELLVRLAPGRPSVLLLRLAASREGPTDFSFPVQMAGEAGSPEKRVQVPVHANVMHRSKGVPCLRPSVSCVGHAPQGEETDAGSDWAGFD